MLSTAIIIFREVMEIALILSIVLAATKGLAGRMPWIFAGFAGGFAGAGLVAVFGKIISAAASGLGQELFNALVLFAAASVIGWTVLWMHKHAREMTAHMKSVGHQVAEGKLPFYSLSLIIALAVLREGSEVVLFIYGMIYSGQSAASIITGSVVGLGLGAIAGVMLYMGLLKMSTRYMFKVTTWLLVLLVAGLASQGAGFLSAAGYFGEFSAVVWNSAWLLDDGSILGKALHSLIGYTAHPTEIELAFYVITFLTLVLIMKHGHKFTRSKAVEAALALALMLILPHPALALDKIYSPNVVKGELEVEASGSTAFDHNSDKNNAQEDELEFEYGATNRFQGGLSIIGAKEPGENFIADAVEAEGRFQFFETGEMWMDSGLLVAYGHAIHRHTAPDDIEAKLLLEKQSGKILTLANIGLEQEIGNHSSGGPDPMVLVNSRYLYNEHFAPGIELQSEFGKTSDRLSFKNQAHYVGPAAYGDIIPGLKYEAAYLFGATPGSADSAARLLVEYEWHI